MLRVSGVVGASLLALTLLVLAVNASAAEPRGTKEEAQALVAKAVAHYDELGSEATFKAIEKPDGEFVDRDLYIFVFGSDRIMAAHGADASLVGTPVDIFIDVNGKPFGTELLDGATEEGVWVDYTWYDPVSRELHPKSSWVVRHKGLVFGAGVYLQPETETPPDSE